MLLEEWREDLSAAFHPNAENVLTHEAAVSGMTPPGGTMDARVELVYYK